MAPTLTNVYRADGIPIVFKATYTEEGYLMDRPILTTTGIFEYRNKDGSIRRELRLPEDVFSLESLSSYKGKPVIITHDAGLITKDNVHQHQIGTILSEGYRSGNDVRAEICIHDTDEMKRCGLKGLSLGYDLDLEEVPGVWEGQHYDARQRNIRINHLALVLNPRAGDKARLNIDGRDSKTVEKGEPAMSEPKKGTGGVLSPEELQAKVDQYKKDRADENNTNTDGKVEEKPVVSTEPSTPAADNDEKPAAVPTIEDRLNAIRERRGNEDGDDDVKELFGIIEELKAQKTKKDGEDSDPVVEEPAKEDGADPVPEEPAAEPEKKDGDDPKEEPVVEEPSKEDSKEDPAVEEPKTEEPAKEDGKDCDPKKDCNPTVNADSMDAIITERIQIGMFGRQLNLDGLEMMNPLEAKKAVIGAARPDIRLDGKSDEYIHAAYDFIQDEAAAQAKKGTDFQKRQMFNKDSAPDVDAGVSARDARQRMIERQQNKN